MKDIAEHGFPTGWLAVRLGSGGEFPSQPGGGEFPSQLFADCADRLVIDLGNLGDLAIRPDQTRFYGDPVTQSNLGETNANGRTKTPSLA